MSSFSMPLNNTGDDVLLIDAAGTIVHQVTYTTTSPGARISFP